MNKGKTDLSLCRVGLYLISLLMGGMFEDSACALQSFPGWSAPIRIPTTSTRATFPDIVAQGNTIHVVFRSTTTPTPESQRFDTEDAILGQIGELDRFLRLGSKETLEALGGKEKLRSQRQALMKKLEELQGKRQVADTRTTPVNTIVYYTRSTDRGRTWWETPLPVTKDPTLFYGQTALAIDGNTIHVVYTSEWTDNAIHVFATSSSDDGKTWTTPVKISTSSYNAFDPQMVTIPGGGLIVCWWELEQTEIEVKQRMEFDAMESLIQNPISKVQSGIRSRSSIHFARFISGNWMQDQVMAQVDGVVNYLNMAEGLRNNIYIFWPGNYGIDSRVTYDSGTTWETNVETAQVLSGDNYYSFIAGQDDLHFIQGSPNKNKASGLSYRRGLLSGTWKNIIEEQTQHSFPRMGYTLDETQVIWGTSDLSGNHILYFREDNKPPTSKLVYPPTGDFTKYNLSFIWGATDDISTRLTYRWTLMNRANPKVRPEPHNWSLYDAQNYLSMKAPEDGYYTLYIQATDFSGNEEKNPTAHDFQTYYVPPQVAADLTTLPTQTINTRNIEIKWKVEDNSTGFTPLIAYRLDGNPMSDFAPRNSVRITGLRKGWHQVQLFGVDANGNVSTFGETVTVNVKFDVDMFWQQIPTEPKEGDVVYVKEDRTPLRWDFQDTTQDQGINYMSSIQVIKDGAARPWTPAQFNRDIELSDVGGGPLSEGRYQVNVLAQDEYGNPVRNQISTAFTVDRTPPTLTFQEPQYDEETKIPTITVTAVDNFCQQANIEYQFRVQGATEEATWTPWAKEAVFTIPSQPVKFYTWGYIVEARARDVAGNVNPVPYQFDALLWYRRMPWMLYTLIGVGVVVVLLVVYLVLSMLMEKRRAKKRAAAKKAAQQAAIQPEEQLVTVPKTEDDLFGAPSAAQTGSGGMDDFFSSTTTSGSSATSTAASDDFWGSPTTTSSTAPTELSVAPPDFFADPFAVKEEPPQSRIIEEAPHEAEEPMEIEIGSPLFSAPTEEPEPTPKPAKKERDWDPMKKVELNDHDLFDPWRED